jgi:hypothetical protein
MERSKSGCDVGAASQAHLPDLNKTDAGYWARGRAKVKQRSREQCSADHCFFLMSFFDWH